MRIYRFSPLLSLLFILVFLTSCGIGNDQPSVTDTPTQEVDLTSLPTPVETIVPQDTLTVPPQTTPFPDSPAVVLLAPDPGADLHMYGAIRSALERLAETEALTFEVRSTLDPDQLDAGLRLVVGLPPDPGLTNLAASAPQVQFLAVSIPGLQPTSNLSLISPMEETLGQVSFLAGYIAAVVTPEWRVGVIVTGDSPAGLTARQSFHNGVVFFCGLCQQSHPPYHRYPRYAQVGSGSDEADWRAAADELIAQAVRTVYITPGAGGQALLDYLAGEGINLIGSGPPADRVRDHWITSVRGDYAGALAEAWPLLLAGEGGFSQSVPIALEDVNQDLFSPGRQVLVENLLPDLLGGFIDTGVDPLDSRDD